MPSRFSIVCTTEGTRVPYVGTTPPASCPNNPAHAVDTMSVVVEANSVTYGVWLAWLATTAPTLALYQQVKIGALGELVTGYLLGNYDVHAQSSLLMLSTHAQLKSPPLTNRIAHIESAMDWVELALQEWATRTGQVLEATTIAEVDAVADFDWVAFELAHPNPGVTIPSALSIAD